MEKNIDFDALSRKANESGGAVADLNNVFGETFALEKWLFIARGELPNISPYVAANADYAGGQQMIRAFTDADRLQRFAQDNNLTAADGSAQMLEIPVKGAVEYLEQFIKYGVHGVWFNSDRVSDGYFIPLAQLRPIREHLTKIGWQAGSESANGNAAPESGFVPPVKSHQSTAQKPPLKAVSVIVNDGLMLPSGFYKASTYTCNFYCLVPGNWTENGELKKAYLEKLFEKFYGANWENGNSDGSRYVVDNSFTMVLTADNLKALNWTEEFKWIFTNTEKNHYWLYIADQTGKIKKASPAEFQHAFNEAQKTPAVSPPAPPPSNLEDYGFSQTPDGAPDLRIKIFKTGSVKFGSSLIPLYSAFAPLLADYQGSGEFEKIFKFAPESIGNFKESYVANTHGNYFRLQTFQYTSPNAVADAMTIDSNQLRHIKTGATLLVSFALLNIPASSSAALYFGFEGGKSEVTKLLDAVAPALAAAGFIEAETN